jgi:hypothetical protein
MRFQIHTGRAEKMVKINRRAGLIRGSVRTLAIEIVERGSQRGLTRLTIAEIERPLNRG